MKIIVDSSCDVDEALSEERDIWPEFVPFSLQLDNKQYVDDSDIDLDEFISEMGKSKIVKTAAPSPELYLDKLKGDEEAFIITIGQKLSASYQNALLAKQMYIDEFGEKLIHVFDSHSASSGPALVALKINELAKANTPFNEIVEKVNHFLSTTHTYFVLEKYDNLVKNGRMNGYVAKIAAILSIKPVCMEVDGKLEMIDKARGSNKAFTKIIDSIIKDKVDFENRTLAIGHVKCLEKALWFKEEICKRINIKDVVIVEAAGLVTTYADVEGIIIAY